MQPSRRSLQGDQVTAPQGKPRGGLSTGGAAVQALCLQDQGIMPQPLPGQAATRTEAGNARGRASLYNLVPLIFWFST